MFGQIAVGSIDEENMFISKMGCGKFHQNEQQWGLKE